MEQLDSVCFDLWVAGMETTSNTLYWSLLYVLLNPKVLERVYEELDTKIGSDRIITTTDRPNLNYINATINVSLDKKLRFQLISKVSSKLFFIIISCEHHSKNTVLVKT
ncbi:hypothetical protein CRE_23845 [Caenorhabditis remanei]|uniref:Cytochrome P450 n=1 Tax=Caenorhabditis remanei TaxID=31234 RepID=E3NUL4_CAERE|nr:hypothetical protein CRE_23845 [Caenorhabditis remanei]